MQRTGAGAIRSVTPNVDESTPGMRRSAELKVLNNKTFGQIKSVMIEVSLKLISLLPFRLAQRIGMVIGIFNWLLRTRAARVTQVNLALCLPELSERARSQLAKTSLMETGQTMMETAVIWMGNIDKNLGRIGTVNGEEILDHALKQKKGVILILPHLGNWE
jgi:KDO2-lipid IV(A) lauroyltransferase